MTGQQLKSQLALAASLITSGQYPIEAESWEMEAATVLNEWLWKIDPDELKRAMEESGSLEELERLNREMDKLSPTSKKDMMMFEDLMYEFLQCAIAGLDNSEQQLIDLAMNSHNKDRWTD